MSVLDYYNKRNELIVRQTFHLLGAIEYCLDNYDNGCIDFDFLINSLRVEIENLRKVCDCDID